MKRVLTMAVLAAACLNVACSSFERDWGRAVGEGLSPAPAARDVRRQPPEGAWVGTWRSENTGHSGALRCLVLQPSGGGLSRGEWSFRYHARWGVMSGEFRTAQPVQPGRRGVFVSKGNWTVPKWAGGTYHYEMEITNAGFNGTYRGGSDQGTFSMERPARP